MLVRQYSKPIKLNKELLNWVSRAITTAEQERQMKRFDLLESKDGKSRFEFRFFSNDEKTRCFGLMQKEPGKPVVEFWHDVGKFDGWKKIGVSDFDKPQGYWRR